MAKTTPAGPFSILIVDDSSDDRDYYRRALERGHGDRYRIDEATDGTDGLARISTTVPDCILLDYSLPGMNGLDVLRAIRAEHPYLAVVMLTGQEDVAVAVNALKEGANDYLTKASGLADRLHHAIDLAIENAANARRADRSSRYLRQMIDHIPDPIFMKDEEHRWVDANAAFWSFMKGSPDRFLGKTARDLFPDDAIETLHADEHDLFATGEIRVREESCTDLAGERHVLLTRKGVFHDLDDRKLLVGVMHDVTAMKAQQQALARSEQTFRQAIENAVNGMALVSPEGRWLKVNRALCDLLGYDEDALLAGDIASVTHPDDRAQDAGQLTGIWSEDQGVRQYEKRFVHRTGRVITVLQSVSVVRHRDGRPDYLVVQMADLTEARKMDRMKSEFISTVSHELRTPLTSIRGTLGLVTHAFAGSLTDAGRELVEVATANCERLTVLINDILDIDKISSGEMRLDMQAHDVATLVEKTVSANAGYAERFGVCLETLAFPRNRRVRVDEGRFVQVMSNLISNAVKFSDDGGTVEIRTEETATGNFRFSVADHGAGIAPEFRERIFDRFVQADSSVSRTRNGTGLGLHISRQLVEAMDGVIGFDSEPGSGTIFWVEFSQIVPLPVSRTAA